MRYPYYLNVLKGIEPASLPVNVPNVQDASTKNFTVPKSKQQTTLDDTHSSPQKKSLSTIVVPVVKSNAVSVHISNYAFDPSPITI